MAWTFVAHRGTANNKVSGTTIQVAPTVELPVGAIVVVRCTADATWLASGSVQPIANHREAVIAIGRNVLRTVKSPVNV